MKNIISITLCAVAAMSMTACSNTTSTQDAMAKPVASEQIVQIPNPFISCATMKEAEEMAGFSMTIPKEMPEGYVQKKIQAVSEEMIQICYENGDQEILIRKGKGNEDISGDYNKYEENKTITVGDIVVATRGNGGKVNVATWSDDGYTYAITTPGLDEATISEMVESIR